MTDTIRLATAEDAAELASIYKYYCDNTVFTFEFPPPSIDEFRRRIADTMESHPFLVYEADGVAAGYAYATKFNDRAGYLYDISVSIYIRHNCHSRGIGKKLYSRLLAIAKKQGFLMAYASITCPNEKSFGLHAAFGFEHVALFKRIGFKLDRWLDVAYLEKRLGECSDRPTPPSRLADLPAGYLDSVLRLEE